MLSAEKRRELIARIREFPAQIEALVHGLTDEQLARHEPGEWNTRQIIHHLPDSHMNGFIRMRFALTEDTPIIMPYDEAAWSLLPDSVSSPLEPSLLILKGLHARWVTVLESLTEEQWARRYYHPANKALVSLDDMLAIYADHCEAHIRQMKRALA